MAADESERGVAPPNASPATVFSESGMGQVWQSGAAARAQSLGPATELMLDLAGLTPGHIVLDIATGTGDTALLAAARVGPTGRVLATDISPQERGGGV